ncbi:pectinesterase inhibitor-like [Rosa sericea]
MVSSSSSIACIAVMSFLVLVSTAPSSAFTLNKDICSNTKVLSRSFCSQFLGSNPVVIKSLLLSLAEATIDVASSNATKTSQLIIKWQNQTDNPQLKNAIRQCPTPYSEAIADLKEAKEKVRSGDYVALQRAAVDASIKFHACEEKFEDTPPDPSPLCSSSGELAAISSILIAVFEILAKSYK